MKVSKYIKIFVFVCWFIVPELLYAVTDKEMEEARTIATKAYLRYANDGSGYLDDLNPTNMEELEASLKQKEKENIKAFKEIPVPSDYKNWDKDQLVQFWAVTAFQSKGLLEKGRGGRIRARSQINKMTIAEPQAETAQNLETEVSTAETPATDETIVTPEDINAAENEILAEENAEEEFDVKIDKASNYTWVYIMVLAILVAIVVALVVYAANVLKKNPNVRNQAVQPSAGKEEDREAVENLEAIVADKDVEIAMLKRKLDTVNKQNQELKSKVDNLSSELNALRYSAKPVVAKDPMEPSPRSVRNDLRTIYLGRANSRGIFIRADRNLNVGNSVFVLETSDGFSGTFKVADSSAAWDLALSNPHEYLENACSGYDLEDTYGATKIITDSVGTAIFEGGCWRVVKKARIRYE